MFDRRNKNISESMDWCVGALDTLNELPPDMAVLCGLDLVLGWKAALENAMPQDGADDESSD